MASRPRAPVLHPAIAAWQTLAAGRAKPERVETIEEKSKSAVYRLPGAERGGSAVIAKRGRRNGLLVERTIYLRVLSRLPVPTLRCYGFLEDEPACWLFLEEADGRRFSTRNAADRALAGRWLGEVHAAVDPALEAELPDRGSGHYLAHLRPGRAAIRQSLARPGLAAGERAILESTARLCDRLESWWSRIEEFYEAMPRTLVHGDFVQKNARVRDGRAGPELLILDWEVAGWGPPAADLSQTGGGSLDPDLTAYWTAVRARWPELELDDIVALADHGAVFRSLAAISWESRKLGYGHDTWPVRNIAVYRNWLARALRAIGFPR